MQEIGADPPHQGVSVTLEWPSALSAYAGSYVGVGTLPRHAPPKGCLSHPQHPALLARDEAPQPSVLVTRNASHVLRWRPVGGRVRNECVGAQRLQSRKVWAAFLPLRVFVKNGPW